MAKSKHSPAFQFYADDWLGSTQITLMTPAEEGAYIRLLAVAWNATDCGLPDDDDQLAVLSRLREAWFDGSGDKVRRCFFSKNERLFNTRLLAERKKQREWKRKSSEGGKASAESRAKARRAKALEEAKGGARVVQPPHQPNGNSPSPSPSPSSSPKKRHVYTPDFEKIWVAYPGNDGKFKSSNLVQRAMDGGVTLQEILDGIERYRAYVEHERKGGFQRKWKGGAVFFGNRNWEDEWTIEQKPKKLGYQP
ncbi:MAG: hypothetical protein ACYTEQ_00805 [Planctomycetota bacterium]|jgi:uncharacterized protein YdaU (DUF1376 family)